MSPTPALTLAAQPPSATAGASAPPSSAAELISAQPVTDHRNPLPYRKLSDAETARYDFGMLVFNTQFVVAGTPGAGRRDGVGPLFNAASCDQCHNNGAHGRGPVNDGPAPVALVIQLTSPSPTNPVDPEGDATYGRVFNTLALDTIAPEGVATIHYDDLPGHYSDGTSWHLRVPHYQLTNLQYGPLAPRTIVKPRLAPALFGIGLLNAVDASRAIYAGAPTQPVVHGITASKVAIPRAAGPRATDTSTVDPGTSNSSAASSNTVNSGTADSTTVGSNTVNSSTADSSTVGSSTANSSAAATSTDAPAIAAPNAGRFGWQSSAVSVRDQTARAFAREMGLTSADISHDDCTSVQTACLKQPNGGSPEVSAELFNAVLDFQRWLSVPASPKPHSPTDEGGKLFVTIGCASCHQPQLPVTLTDSAGQKVDARIAPYTDLRLHDLGVQLADEDISGRKVPSRWRTAPLWGLGYRISLEKFPTFLHDGRARSVEEAILWHGGEATNAKSNFEKLPATQRAMLLRWVETL
jgi:CxxC motif-containing protein (DUF1111 family)